MIRVLAVMDKAKRESRLRELMSAVFAAAQNYNDKLTHIYDDGESRFVNEVLRFAANDDEETLIKIAVASIEANATAEFFKDKRRPVRVYIGANSDDVIVGFFRPAEEETEWVTLLEIIYPAITEDEDLQEGLIDILLED